MQTFIPEDGSFGASAACLDYRRLGKQRVECLQILQALDPTYNPHKARKGWVSHPAVRMWRGHQAALALYGRAVCLEWLARGYRDNVCLSQISEYIERHGGNYAAPLPPWWGDARIHLSHKSNLIRKAPEHYRPIWPEVPDNLPYHWPTDTQE